MPYEKRDIDRLLDAIAEHLPAGATMLANAFIGDPEGNRRWGVRPVRREEDGRWIVPGSPQHNRYLCISAFRPSPVDGRHYRRKDLFAAGLVFMIDDVGTKLDLDLMRQTCLPSAVLETSP